MIDATSIDETGSESVPHAISATADPDDLCPTCGRTIAQHHSSVGAAPRNPKALLCPACGLKAHQNIDVQTARLECLWRQFADATGLIKITQSANGTQRVKLPKADVANVLAFGKWLEARESATPGQVDAQDTQTTSTAQRAAARAASAPPQPTDTTAEPDHPAQTDGLPNDSDQFAPDPLADDLEEQIRAAANVADLDDDDPTEEEIQRLAAGTVFEADVLATAPDDDQPDSLDVDGMVKSTVSLDSLAW